MAYHIGGLTTRLVHLERAVDETRAEAKVTRAEIDKLKSWGQRVAILLVLWSAGTSAHLGSEQLSDLLAQLVRTLLIK
jgi:hypothetical protein